jgi:hypothetical protein
MSVSQKGAVFWLAILLIVAGLVLVMCEIFAVGPAEHHSTWGFGLFKLHTHEIGLIVMGFGTFLIFMSARASRRRRHRISN